LKFQRILFAALILAHTACDRQRDSAAAGASGTVAPTEGFDRVWGAEPLSALELESLIEELDTAAREENGIGRKLADQLLEGIGGGVPASMSLISWRHFFNSSLNALAASECVGSDEIARVLMDVMERDEDKVMRLYALQHIEIHQPRVKEPLRSEIGNRVASLAYAEDDEISGTAVLVMERWKGEVGEGAKSIPKEDRSAAVVKIISDAKREADVRVTAVHTAVDGGYPDALPAARAIAADPSEDTMLRKAAIHLIGQLGNQNDSDLLVQCAAENNRLAQAARPAIERLSDRMEGRPEPKLIPYR
jgi:hypothetical protein